MEVRARREPEPAHEARAEIRQDVTVQVVGHDHLEALGLAHQFHRERVHVAVLGGYLRVFCCDRP